MDEGGTRIRAGTGDSKSPADIYTRVLKFHCGIFEFLGFTKFHELSTSLEGRKPGISYRFNKCFKIKPERIREGGRGGETGGTSTNTATGDARPLALAHARAQRRHARPTWQPAPLGALVLGGMSVPESAEAPSTRAGPGRWTTVLRLDAGYIPGHSRCVRGVCFKRNETKIAFMGWSMGATQLYSAPLKQGDKESRKRKQVAAARQTASHWRGMS